MARPDRCQICRLSTQERGEIDARIARGDNLAGIARDGRVSYRVLREHRKHVAAAALVVMRRQEEDLGAKILGDVAAVENRAREIMQCSSNERDLRAELAAGKLLLEACATLRSLLSAAKADDPPHLQIRIVHVGEMTGINDGSMLCAECGRKIQTR